MSQSIHGHDIMRLIQASDPPLSREELGQEVSRRFGEDVSFETCGGGGMSLEQLLEFLTKRGKVVGTVTSCAKVGDTQIGLALVPTKLAEPGTWLQVFPVPPRVPPAKAVNELAEGDVVALSRPAVVLDRFRRVD